MGLFQFWRKKQQGVTNRRKTTHEEAGQQPWRPGRVEVLEPRYVLSANPLFVGARYLEQDLGEDSAGPDTFEVTFSGGAQGTQLNQIVIDGDHNDTPGVQDGDLFFDTVMQDRTTDPQALGRGAAFPFQIVNKIGDFGVTATVADGGTSLVLNFTGFDADEKLLFSIDVDEANNLGFRPNDPNAGVDEITSGNEFQASFLQAQFSAANFHDAEVTTQFVDVYDLNEEGALQLQSADPDASFTTSGLDLPDDNFDGQANRSAAGVGALVQTPLPITISGTVFHDRNVNHVQDPGDEGIGGVTLTLQQQNEAGQYENVIRSNQTVTTLTDASGDYHFGTELNLLPGTFRVVETQPEAFEISVAALPGTVAGEAIGSTAGTNVLTEVTIEQGGTHAVDYDFAEANPAEISGYVYHDRDNDGLREPNQNEESIANVTLSLIDADGNLVTTRQTNSAGYYRFENVLPGEYRVVETQPTAWIDGKDTVGTIGGTTVGTGATSDELQNITVRSDDVGIDYNFGERLGSLSGYVHVDRDGDCLRDPGEQAIEGVTIRLIDQNGAEVTTTTDANGHYEFLDLAAGTYTVLEDQPADYFTGGEAIGTGTGTNPAANRMEGVEISSQHIALQEYNFCEALGSLSGHVYHDRDNDGRRETGEEPIANVVIELRDADGQPVRDSDGNARTATTNSAGYYQFTDLAPGEYRLVERHPSDWIDGLDTPGTVGGTTVGQVNNPGDSIRAIDLTNTNLGRQGINYDFGERLGSLSGFVHVDDDGDCIRDPGEEAIEGVLVTLTNEAGDTFTTLTNSNGQYFFDDLPAGIYTVTETQPAEYFHNDQRVGNGTGNDSTANVISDVAINGEHVNLTEYNFCEAVGQISGYVYHDRDNNGLREPGSGEEAIPDVTLRLYDGSGQQVLDAAGNPLEAVTNSAGYYEFNDLAPGEYRVVEQQPTLWIDGLDTPGTVDGVSSGAATNPGDSIGSIMLTQPDLNQPGNVGVNYNFGERHGSLEGYVHLDDDGDCVFDPEEQPLSGVTVTLVDQFGNETVTQTDASGRYRFDDLSAGSYTVIETQPLEYFDAGHVAGSAGGDVSVANEISGVTIDNENIDLVDYNFCEEVGMISGHVYHDENLSGTFEGEETGIAGVTVQLIDDAGNQVASTQTNADGFYKFNNVSPGIYKLQEVQPAGWLDNVEAPGTVAGTTSGVASEPDMISLIDLTTGSRGIDYDFGEVLPGSITGIVYSDPNDNCIVEEGEERLDGVTVKLLNAAGEELATTETDEQGRYTFDGLRPGEYSVMEVQPDGFFQGGQVVGSGSGNISLGPDMIGEINIGSGDDLTDYNFCEVPPSSIAGYVFQDGAPITTPDGKVPDDLRGIRDGLRTADDTPLAGVELVLVDGLSGIPIDASQALNGIYPDGPISVVTDAAGFYEFVGIPGNANYAVYEASALPEYFDGIDTAGTTGGFTINPGDTTPEFVLQRHTNAPTNDAILSIPLAPGQRSVENNFSEVVVDDTFVPPPPPPPPPPLPPPPGLPPLLAPPPEVQQPWLLIPPPEPIPTYGSGGMLYSWHLSIVDAGRPRGNGLLTASGDEVWQNAAYLRQIGWTPEQLRSGLWIFDAGQENYVDDPELQDELNYFGIIGALPVSGDFNGDGIDELGLFYRGEWFLDLNGNGHWDDQDLWARLGDTHDLPVVGDWDGDGKDDIGIYGPQWPNDPRAIEVEPGLPDPANMPNVRAKNLPPHEADAPDGHRELRLTSRGEVRADLIDHVFRFGDSRDQPIAGDWNGDGIRAIGIFRGGNWQLDLDGDGRWSKRDGTYTFGQEGDRGVVGDFNGDGIDEIGIFREGTWIVDTNGNRELEATDQVFELGGKGDLPVVGDFNGDGIDEAAIYRHVDAPPTRTAAVPQREAG